CARDSYGSGFDYW
nr:immunoglobulin heavy chain junction region [Macaca mulatta]MOV35827.1 immunoglobulin heavy chain junction region [Macaca mulatta]MOV35866.1 immunoglobulin heavy chain junction region [Macaca mulatta]MOV35890.1 immunoglobulin heavy chain junction region [Macaca mulatta]MOV35973.1 immunoglobulin heavy chain junction region [Macaca mulatta]